MADVQHSAPATPVAPAAASTGHDARIRAVVLAAGRGSRLGSAEDHVPKCLLEIGRRRLIEHQLDALAGAGVGPTTVVVGYGASEVREIVGMRAEFVANTRWSSTNSLASFLLARDAFAGPAMILNSDVLFAPQVLDRLLEVEGDAIAIDSSSGPTREQMKVRIRDGLVVDMRKDLPAHESGGENVGILKLGPETLRDLVEVGERLLGEGQDQAWLAAAMREVLARRPIAAVDVAGLPWVEIDFPTDLDRARKQVWPRIAGERPRRTLPMKVVSWALLPLALAVPFGLGFLSSNGEATWEAIEPSGIGVESVRLGELERAWWYVPGGESARVRVRGPGPVRIDTRLLDPEPGLGQYVIEVLRDGERVDWYEFQSAPSGTATHPSWIVGKRKRVTVDLEDGVHEVVARMIAPADRPYLVRFRQLDEGGTD